MHTTFPTSPRTIRSRALLTSLVGVGMLALAGCGGDGESQGPFVTPVLDTDRESAALIGPEGGTVTASAADGTEYALSIPADALIEETEISLTPILNIEDLPMSGGFVAGVHFEPSGLELFRVATLTVKMPLAPSLGDEKALAGFVYDDDGENLALGLAEADGNSFTLPIHHFSGAGTGAANPNELEAEFVPGTADAFVAQLLEAESSGDVAAIDAVIESWYQSRVRPSLQAAVSNDEALERALAERARWLAAAEYFGSTPLIDGLITDSENLAGDAFREAVARANDLCERQASFEEAEKALLWQRRAESVLPDDELFAEGLDRQAVLNELCLQVVFESTSFPQSPIVGAPATLSVVVGYSFGGEPTEFTEDMLVSVLATGATPGADNLLTDELGEAMLELTPTSAGVSLEAEACISNAPGAGFLTGVLVCQTAFIVRGLVVTPGSVGLEPGGTASFAALLGGSPADVIWSAGGGTIDDNGLYTAGDVEGAFEVRATSVDDPMLTATATIAIERTETVECFAGAYLGTIRETLPDGTVETFENVQAGINTCNPQRQALVFSFSLGPVQYDNALETLMGTPDEFFGSLRYRLNGTPLPAFDMTEVRGSASVDTMTFTAVRPWIGVVKVPITFTGTCNQTPACGPVLQ